MKNEFSEVLVEAALCLWEEMVCHRDDPLWKAYWDQQGTNHVRHDIIALAEPCDKEWNAMSEDEKEKWIPYDWEWCPHFLRNRVEWNQRTGPHYKGK